MRGEHIGDKCLGALVNFVCGVGVNSRVGPGGPSGSLKQED